MGKLRVFFRIRQRQNSNPEDYFGEIRRKYPRFKFSDMGTFYLPLEGEFLEKARRHFFVTSDNSMIVREMVGEITCGSAEEAESVIDGIPDLVYAEFVIPFRVDRGPV